jgi:site-specific recombinase XerD
LVLILAYSGLRAREVCALRISDVNLAERSILVRDGKGSQDRIVHVSEDCIKVMQKYLLSDHRKKAAFLFMNNTNNPLSPYALRKTIKRITKRTTLEKRVYPHLFRHSLATNLLINGCNLLAIKEQLGHRNIQTTFVYLHSTPMIRRAMYDRFCPRYGK